MCGVWIHVVMLLICNMDDNAPNLGHRLDRRTVLPSMLDAFWWLAKRVVHDAANDSRRKVAEHDAIHDVLAKLARLQNALTEDGRIGDINKLLKVCRRAHILRALVLDAENVGKSLLFLHDEVNIEGLEDICKAKK
jgi:hypothetical protein